MKKFEEGQVYPFRVLNIIYPDIPEDAAFVLKGPGERKMLMPVRYYEDYNINIGDTINCRIDKINCSGKVFLEPEHPYYKEAKEYPFELLEIRITENEVLQKMKDLILLDAFGVKRICRLPYNTSIEKAAKTVVLHIDRIKKGVFDLSFRAKKYQPKYIEGKTYYFKLLKKIKNSKGEPLLVVSDEHQGLHHLPEKYFKHYELKIGEPFTGTFVRYGVPANLQVEPENPIYKLGEIYQFPIQRVYQGVDPIGQTESAIYVLDKFGMEIKVEAKDYQANKDSVGKLLPCRVIRIRKGRLFLENLSVDMLNQNS